MRARELNAICHPQNDVFCFFFLPDQGAVFLRLRRNADGCVSQNCHSFFFLFFSSGAFPWIMFPSLSEVYDISGTSSHTGEVPAPWNSRCVFSSSFSTASGPSISAYADDRCVVTSTVTQWEAIVLYAVAWALRESEPFRKGKKGRETSDLWMPVPCS